MIVFHKAKRMYVVFPFYKVRCVRSKAFSLHEKISFMFAVELGRSTAKSHLIKCQTSEPDAPALYM